MDNTRRSTSKPSSSGTMDSISNRSLDSCLSLSRKDKVQAKAKRAVQSFTSIDFTYNNQKKRVRKWKANVPEEKLNEHTTR